MEKLGFGGRVGLHSLEQAERFYQEGCRMMRIGTDPVYYRLAYFEYAKGAGAAWLAGREDVRMNQPHEFSMEALLAEDGMCVTAGLPEEYAGAWMTYAARDRVDAGRQNANAWKNCSRASASTRHESS